MKKRDSRYPYDALNKQAGCLQSYARHAALTSGVYTLIISLLVAFLYCWRLSIDMKKYVDLQDVYYGVQIAHVAIVGTQLFMVILSVVLIYGVFKEECSLISLWIIGCISFMSLEAVAMVYSNVLRDHVNKQFDVLCKAEVAFFLTRGFLNVIAIYGVMKFYNLVRADVTWKGSDAIEL